MQEGFVNAADAVPGVLVDPRYAGSDNFLGRQVAGYNAPKVIISKEVAEHLNAVQQALAKVNMALKLFDGYRPQRAVDDFVRWASDVADTVMKARYYPNVDKADLFKLGYIAARSGHSRGGCVDLTVVQKGQNGQWQDLDMGSPWDLFDEISHPESPLVSMAAQHNRRFLSELMQRYGFAPYAAEWWHFTLVPEPYPDTYFDFPIE